MTVCKDLMEALIVADDDARAGTIAAGLLDASGVVVDRILLTADLESRVAAIDPDVLLVDIGRSGAVEIERVMSVARSAARPIVVFADETDREMAQAVAAAGVSAYVVDGLRRERMKGVLDVAIGRHRAYAELLTELDAARVALEERKVVDRAKSFLMRHKGLAEDEAYALMRRAAMNRGIKLAQIARSVLAAAELVSHRETK